MAYTDNIRSSRAGLAERFAVFYGNFQEQRQRRKVFNQTRDELNSLSDRELNDLGIARASISRISREAAYGK